MGDNQQFDGGPPPANQIQQQIAAEVEQRVRNIEAALNSKLDTLEDRIIIKLTEALSKHAEPSQGPPAENLRVPTPTILTPIGSSTVPSRSSSPPIGDPAVTSKRKQLPWPSAFSGERGKWRAFKAELEEKISLDEDLIGGSRFAWYGINSCLGDKPKALVSTYFSNGAAVGWDPQLFIKHLDTMFGDPNEAQKAMDKLYDHKQGDKQPFINYLAKFEQLVADAGGSNWPDHTKLLLVNGGINKRIRSALVSAKVPKDYAGWVREVTEIAYKAEFAGSWPTPPRQDPATVQPRDTPHIDPGGDTIMGGINAARTAPAGGPATDKPRAPRAVWVSREIMDQRRNDGLCLRCGGENHRVASCRLRPAVRPFNISATATLPMETGAPDEAGKE